MLFPIITTYVIVSYLDVGRRSLELNLVFPIKSVKFSSFIFVNVHLIILFQFIFWVFARNILYKSYKILKLFSQVSKTCENLNPEKPLVGWFDSNFH